MALPCFLHHGCARYLSRLPWDLIDSPFEALWAKNGKYEYCYFFGNSQNCPKCRPRSLHAPLN